MVYVQSSNGQPIMPTLNHVKVRMLLKHGKAKVVRRCPFTIKLLYESTTHTQEVSLGVDTGHKHIGMCASTEKQVLYKAEVLERTDIVDLLKARREARRARRSRKTRYRAPRFNNRVRTKHKGWLAPSVQHKIDTHVRVIKKAMEIQPVTKIRVETAEFDIHKLKNPDVNGRGYQHGEKYGHINTRNYVLWRDGHRCRHCGHGSVGEDNDKLYVVSADGRETVAPEDLYTLCDKCFKEHMRYGGVLPSRRRHFAPPTQMGIMRDALLEQLRKEVNIPVEQTYGYVTKGIREENGITKSHTNDAYCIAGNLKAKQLDEEYLIKKVRCHNRQIHKFTINKGGTRKRNQAPYEVKGFKLFDKVKFKGAECFIFGRRVSGSFDVRTLNGTKVSPCAGYKKLKLLNISGSLLVERRRAVPPMVETKGFPA